MCNGAGPFTMLAQQYHYDVHHPQRFTEPSKALVQITTAWGCEGCKKQFIRETKPDPSRISRT